MSARAERRLGSEGWNRAATRAQPGPLPSPNPAPLNLDRISSPTTYISVTEIHLDLRQSQSLKEKRKVVSSLKAQIRHRFVAAIAETAHHDDRRRVTLVCALVGGAEVRECSEELERFVEARCPDGCRFDRSLVTLADLTG